MRSVPALLFTAALLLLASPPSAPARSDGARLLFRPQTPASAQNPAFSPDGTGILFTLFHRGYNSGPAGLYLLSPASGEVAALLDEQDQDSVNLPGSSWNATTDRITFSSDRRETDEIWTISPGGTALFRVTHRVAGGSAIEPSFSPDGEWIVFEAVGGTAGDRRGSLWKVRRDGSALTRLTGGPDGELDDRQPNWSPRGDRIAFQRRRAGSEDWDLYTIAADGRDLRPVVTGPSGDTDVSWSPDGRWLVFSSDHGGRAQPKIFVVAAGGGQPQAVTSDPGPADAAPSWSPDGAWIAFESHPGEDEPAALWRIAAPPLPGGSCQATDLVLCVQDGRFAVEVSWRDFSDRVGPGRVAPFVARDSGLFWFFSASNLELLVKVLDGCAVNDRFWVFAAAATNVEYRLRVTDLATGAVTEYVNPLGVRSPAVTDTNAFRTCPGSRWFSSTNYSYSHGRALLSARLIRGIAEKRCCCSPAPTSPTFCSPSPSDAGGRWLCGPPSERARAGSCGCC